MFNCGANSQLYSPCLKLSNFRHTCNFLSKFVYDLAACLITVVVCYWRSHHTIVFNALHVQQRFDKTKIILI
jgi:hypothetical protein